MANFISVTNDYEKLLKEADDSVGDMLGLESVVKGAQDITKIFKVVRILIYGFGALIILLTLWAATARKTGLCILCIILFCPLCAMLSNVLLAVGCFAMFVALAVTTSIVNKAWKKTPC